MTDYLKDLTAAQSEAVTHVEGPMLVLAGPGSGKTRVVTSRIAHLLHQGVGSENILALTFTNKAADEMRMRVGNLAPGHPVWMSTFHRFCSKLLRRYARFVGLSENFRIYDTEDSLKALKTVIDEGQFSLRRMTPNQIARTISNAKNILAAPEQFQVSAVGPLETVAAEIYPGYQRQLIESNAVDFDDLLMHVANLLRENEELRAELDEFFRFILVDEYQDTNLAQYMIVRALSINHPNLSVTGDPDQSIYAWRGADIKNILEFEKDYPSVRVVRLEQNYRSTKRILEVADQLIANNMYRKEKSLYTDNPEGQPVRLVRYQDGHEEAEDIARQISECILGDEMRPRDFAVLFRTNALTRNFEHALREYGVPYQMVNGVEFYQRKEIKDVLAYLHLINNSRDSIALERVINTPPRGIGKKSLQYLRAHSKTYRMSMLETCRDCMQVAGLSARAQTAISRFVTMFDGMCEAAGDPVEGIVGRVLMDSGYRDHLKDSPTEEDQQRLANVEELVTAAKQFDDRFEEGGRLEEFLEQTSLISDVDAWDAEGDKITLMTLHAAKGLEFPVIFIVAVEEGILPHERARHDLMQTEEERRLLFVGITRAKHNLQLSLTQSREYRGRHRQSIPSSFLLELPRDNMECFGTDPSMYHGIATDESDDESLEPEEVLDEIAMEYAQQEFAAELQQATADAYDGVDEPADSSEVAPVMSAAQMLGADEFDQTEEVPPEAFSLGMLVMHPKYGPGKIVALSGKGVKRVATVQFLQPPERTKFRLAFCPLRPMSSST
ncbi:MAG: UvrD-helicase domain-containing protein [Planctomycetota bacterium]